MDLHWANWLPHSSSTDRRTVSGLPVPPPEEVRRCLGCWRSSTRAVYTRADRGKTPARMAHTRGAKGRTRFV